MSVRALQIREARDADVPAIAELFDATYGQPLDTDLFRWKLWGQAAPAPTSWIAEVHGTIVGHCGGTPLVFEHEGASLPAMHSCHAMVRGDLRGQGVLSALHAAEFDRWRRGRVAFAMGLPSGRPPAGDQPIGPWQPVGSLTRRRLVLRWDRVLARRLRGARALAGAIAFGDAARRVASGFSRTTRTTVRELTGPDADWDAMWLQVGRCHPEIVRRDQRWIDYRYRRAPGRHHRFLLAERDGAPIGALVTRTPGPQPGGAHGGPAPPRTGWIADILTVPDDTGAADALITSAVALMRCEGVDDIRTLVMPGTWLDRCLARAGFFRSRGEYPIGIVPLSEPCLMAVRRDDWFFTGGDFDVV